MRPDGSPHLMPIIAFWIDDAFHFVVREGTRKGRNLAADGRCVIATGSTTLPSLDIVVEGHAKPLDDEAAVERDRRDAQRQQLATRGSRRPGLRSQRPDRGSAAVLDLPDVPSKAFGLPGMLGMEKYDRDRRFPKPTRWEFDGA